MIVATTTYRVRCDCCGVTAPTSLFSPTSAHARRVAGWEGWRFATTDDVAACPVCAHAEHNRAGCLPDQRKATP